MNPLTVVYTWLKNHPKILCASLCLLAFILGYGSSFYAHPAKVMEHTKVVTQVQTKIEYKDRVVTQKVYVQAEKKKTHSTTTTVKNKDGSSTTTTTTDTSTDETASNHQTTDENKQQVVTQIQTQIVEKEKLVLRQPDNRLYAGIGYQFATFGGAPETGIPGMRGTVVQIGYDRRIAGPVFLGVSLNTQYTAFLNVSAAF